MSIVTRPHARLRRGQGRLERKLVLPPWYRRPASSRRGRVAVAGAALAAVVAVALAVVLRSGGASEAPPATAAARVVPADALAYVNLSTDTSRPAVSRARALGARFPDWPILATAALNRFDAVVGGSSAVDFSRQIRPWLGNEASLALVPAADGSAQSVVVLAVARRARAHSFVTGEGAVSAGAYDGIRLFAYPSGTELAFIGQYLVAGPDAGVRAAIDAARGRAPSLAHDRAYERATADEPADRVLDAYIPASGVGRLLAARTGVLGALGVLLSRPGIEGAGISLSAVSGGARVQVHSVRRVAADGSRSGPSFRPTLQSILPSGSTLMIDVAGLDRAAPELLSAAATAGIAGNVGPLLRRLGVALASEGVNVGSVESIFGGETAVAVSPGSAPALLIVSRVRNEAAARSELASLEAPMAALFPASSNGPGQVPELADQQVGGVTVHELGLGPGLRLGYAVFNRLAVVSTSVRAIGSVAQRSRSLDDDAEYKATLSDRPDQLSSLVFADVSRLLALGQQLGLASGTRTRELLPDLGKIRAVGVSSASQGTDTTTELSLEIP